MSTIWLPILDHELPAVRKCFPAATPVRRDGAWWVRVVSRGDATAAADAIRVVIAEELTGRAVHAVTTH